MPRAEWWEVLYQFSAKERNRAEECHQQSSGGRSSRICFRPLFGRPSRVVRSTEEETGSQLLEEFTPKRGGEELIFVTHDGLGNALKAEDVRDVDGGQVGSGVVGWDANEMAVLVTLASK
ncbi:hypothetical protein Scep_016839 [Stephania cephalantha]|uniref:Uncharacterized protein n=1 Tax=Stephania cephalantha TaxID=152367 RepID=A0AAP0INH5_9MAGN